MRIVVALGGNALLKRGEPLTAEAQRSNIRIAAEAMAPLAQEHQLVISHGNGPQVGLLALQGAAYKPDEAYPLDVLGAETEGMIGYMIEQELGNLLPFEVPFATLLTMVEVDGADPGFKNPTKFVGPVYEKPDADRIAADKGWIFKQDGASGAASCHRRAPKRIFEIRPIKWLLEHGTIVICAGGGGIPTMYEAGANRKLDRRRGGDRQGSLLGASRPRARRRPLGHGDRCGSGVHGWGTPEAKAIHKASPAAMARYSFPAGSMGPKIRPPPLRDDDGARRCDRRPRRRTCHGARRKGT